jgi:multiple antibiotic resistance protein
MVREVLSQSLLAFSALFVVVDPFAAVPFFLAMTSGQSAGERRETAKRAAVGTCLILASFGVAGALVFRLLGITIPAFKIAGGILLLLIAVDMIRTRPSAARITAGEVEAGAVKEDVAIVPLAMPLLAGPGSIATVIVLMGRARQHHGWEVLPVLGAVILTAAISFVVLAGASRIEGFMGRTGMNILERVAGLLLAAIALQFVIDGAGEAFPGLLR